MLTALFLCVTIFQEFIPHMAKEYGFQYELVQYKWPRWLHQQTEKQRIIWGYKILFLDVLFPLAVDKILFVDADQVCSHVAVQTQSLILHLSKYLFFYYSVMEETVSFREPVQYNIPHDCHEVLKGLEVVL